MKQGFLQILNQGKFLGNGERQAGAKAAVRPCLTSSSTSSRSNASVTEREYPLGIMAQGWGWGLLLLVGA